MPFLILILMTVGVLYLLWRTDVTAAPTIEPTDSFPDWPAGPIYTRGALILDDPPNSLSVDDPPYNPSPLARASTRAHNASGHVGLWIECTDRLCHTDYLTVNHKTTKTARNGGRNAV